jgi:hypothetical protein
MDNNIIIITETGGQYRSFSGRAADETEIGLIGRGLETRGARVVADLNCIPDCLYDEARAYCSELIGRLNSGDEFDAKEKLEDFKRRKQF